MFLIVKVNVPIDLLEILLTFVGVSNASFQYKSFTLIRVFLGIN